MIERNALLEIFRGTQASRKADYLLELDGLDEAAALESKSSAGDKYETGREMIAQARHILESNLAITQANLNAIERMSLAPPGSCVCYGCLAETNLGWYLVGASLGNAEIDGILVHSLSLASPLDLALKDRYVGDRIQWRQGFLEILGIYPVE